MDKTAPSKTGGRMSLGTVRTTEQDVQEKHREHSWLHRKFSSVLEETGITLNGPHPWDPQIHNARALRRIAFGGSLGAGESYVDGDWDCTSLDQLSTRLLQSGIDERWESPFGFSLVRLAAPVVNFQSRSFASRNVKAHYDIGNELYTAMLGPSMAYSCGYWRGARSLEEAQHAKHELICRKLGLRKGMQVLDIGCGWGGFAKYAAERYDVRVLGVTLSPAQERYAKSRCAELPVEIRLQDYRDVRGTFDRIVSIGMFEHVGPRNYRDYFESAHRNLGSDGLFLLHSIGNLRSVRKYDRWMNRYIFPNAVVPSGAQINRAMEGLFVMEDWHNFGADYDKTLMAWHANFTSVWPVLQETYGKRFHRMWNYFLLTCAGAFRARRSQLWQIVLSKYGVRGGYVRTGL
jgi:cyclopropane-fatty-acyl-phospholipid synthase